ncbi:hypothetical protein P9X10_02710 [Bacillus cereus]|nr:hypothetical protein [Bacillus cereus]
MKIKTVIQVGVVIIAIIILINLTLKNFNKIVPKQEGKPVTAEVIEKKYRVDTKVGKVHEVILKVEEKTYTTLIKEELYNKVEKGTKLDAIEYKDSIKLNQKYDKE